MRDGRSLRQDLKALGRVRAPAAIAAAVRERLGLAEACAPVETPIGRAWVAFRGGTVTGVWRASSPRAAGTHFRRARGRPVRLVASLPVPLTASLRAALVGGGRKGLAFALDPLSEFERVVLRKALEVPAGQVRSYAWVAREIGRPAAVRAVGSALGRNPIPLLIPCHRIVRSDGTLLSHLPGRPADHRAAPRALPLGAAGGPGRLPALPSLPPRGVRAVTPGSRAPLPRSAS